MIDEDFNVDEIYVFVSDCPGGGISGKQVNIGGQEIFMPFVCSSKERLEKMKIQAFDMYVRTGIKQKILKFTHKEEIGVIGD
jgi:hypothetical protein